MPKEIKELKTAADYYEYWNKYAQDIKYTLKNTIYFLKAPLKETEKAFLIEYAKSEDCKFLAKKWVAKSICKELSADGYICAKDEELKTDKVYAMPMWAY